MENGGTLTPLDAATSATFQLQNGDLRSSKPVLPDSTASAAKLQLEPRENGVKIAPKARDSRLRFGDITDKNVEQLRVLNHHLFPVRYNETFYGDVLFLPRGYARFAYWDGLAIGAVCCRLENFNGMDRTRRQRAYIMTLGVLEAYRHYRVGSALLRAVIEQSLRDGVDHIYLHVQTSNCGAIDFYRGFGFAVTETIRNYYRHLEPPDCFVLVKRLAA